jgi:1,4-dihydroxy-2-naphthoyl-CoA hydrolase
MPNDFTFPYTIGLQDTDAAGVIFSANIISICHHGYEAFLEEIGYGMAILFERRTLSLPVVHIEADMMKPLRPGMKTKILVRVAHLGRTSYRMSYQVVDAAGEKCATAATVHVCTDPKTNQPLNIPAEFRAALERFAE